MSYLKEILPVFFIASVPQLFFIVWFSFVFLGHEHEVSHIKKKILLYAVLQSIYVDIFFLRVPLVWHLLNSIAALIVLFVVLFRTIKWFDQIKIMVTFNIAEFLIEFITLAIISRFTNRDIILSNPLYLFLYIWIPIGIIYLSILLMKKYHKYPGKIMYSYLKRSNKSIFSLFIFVALQFFIMLLLGSLIYYKIDYSYHLPTLYILLCVATILCLIALVVTVRVIAQTKDDAIKMTQQVYIEDVDRMFASIRGQRHDFINHVQLMLAFYKQQKSDELGHYMQELVGEISEMNEIVRIEHPALAAFIQTKVAEAMSLKIRFSYGISGINSLSLGFKSIDIVKIIGNLINNAFDEVIPLPPEERWVELSIEQDDSGMHISVRNPGTVLSQTDIENIFTVGFSTKNGTSHSGLGLSIVKERVENYKGKVSVESNQNTGTTFIVLIPLK